MDLNNKRKTAWMLYRQIESTPTVDITPDLVEEWLNNISNAEERAIDDCLHADWPNVFSPPE